MIFSEGRYTLFQIMRYYCVIDPHGEEQRSTVSNHEAPIVATSFETLAAQAPQDEGKEPLLTQ